jgi:hypothetical protein
VGAAEQQRINELTAALDRDRTGLAHALAEISALVAQYTWLADGWGGYGYEEQTLDALRAEAGGVFERVRELAESALQHSGTIAGAAITGRQLDLFSAPETAARCRYLARFWTELAEARERAEETACASSG